MPVTVEPFFYTRKEAAVLLRIAVRTLDLLRARGHIRAVKVAGTVRLRPEDVHAYAAKCQYIGAVRTRRPNTNDSATGVRPNRLLIAA